MSRIERLSRALRRPGTGPALKESDIGPYVEQTWSPEYRSMLAAQVAEYPFPVAGARVLDLGAGAGALTAALLGAGVREVVWQDIDPRLADAARARVKDERVRFVVRDMMDVGGGYAPFDVVILRECLHWATDEAELFRRIRAATSGRGWMLVDAFNWRRVQTAPLASWKRAVQLMPPFIALVTSRKYLPTFFSFERLTVRRIVAAGYRLEQRASVHKHYFRIVARVLI